MGQQPVFPPELWERLQRFMLTQRTGQVVLHVHEGHIKSAEITESWRQAKPERVGDELAHPRPV